MWWLNLSLHHMLMVSERKKRKEKKRKEKKRKEKKRKEKKRKEKKRKEKKRKNIITSTLLIFLFFSFLFDRCTNRWVHYKAKRVLERRERKEFAKILRGVRKKQELGPSSPPDLVLYFWLFCY